MKIKLVVISVLSAVWIAALGVNVFPVTRSRELKDPVTLRKMVREDPANTFALSSLARDLELKKDYTNAALFYRECLRLEPDNSVHYIRLSGIYLKMERPDQAERVLREAVKEFPNNGKVMGAMADVQYHMGDFEKALSLYRMSMELTGETNSSFLYCGMAKASRELKRYDESGAYFRKALESKKELWTFYEYGKLLQETGRHEHAAWAFEKARALSFRQEKEVVDLLQEKLAGAYYDCGMNAKSLGRKTAAREYFDKLLKDRGLQKTKFAEKASFWLKRL
jgi:tetratricopeptide (TPR) repeat protein